MNKTSLAIDRVRSHAVESSNWSIVEMCDLSYRGFSGALRHVCRYAADNRSAPGLMWADAYLNSDAGEATNPPAD